MLILAIETSCDDTSISILDNNIVISSLIYSQIEEHKSFGGIVPEIASRIHMEKIFPLLKRTLEDANIDIKDINAIAVTGGPGLIGTLQIGMIVAKTLSLTLNIPYYKINHLEGHIYSPFVGEEEDLVPKKAIFLIVSGGHTIIGIKNNFEISYLGETRDDAIGECFDKVAKMLNLGYPGGKIIDNRVKNLSFSSKFVAPIIDLPNYNFSYSGLKTWVLKISKENQNVDKILYSFQKAAIEQLLIKLKKAKEEFSINNLIICGGVSDNSYLRQKVKSEFKNMRIFFPKSIYTTDNAAMIGYTYFAKRNILKPSTLVEDVEPNWKAESKYE